MSPAAKAAFEQRFGEFVRPNHLARVTADPSTSLGGVPRSLVVARREGG
jgi:hypothetical protein